MAELGGWGGSACGLAACIVSLAALGSGYKGPPQGKYPKLQTSQRMTPPRLPKLHAAPLGPPSPPARAFWPS